MKKLTAIALTLTMLISGLPGAIAQAVATPNGLTEVRNTGVRKVKDIVIYRDARFHSAFPSVVRRPDGTFLLAFRRAPDRSVFGEKGTSHVDPNSYLVKMTSPDGITWSEPEVFYAHAFGGSQDPCLLQLRNGNLVCASYGWAFLRPPGAAQTAEAAQETGVTAEKGDAPARVYMNNGGATFLGGYLLYSEDGGRSWEGPEYPPYLETGRYVSPLGVPVPAFNRGAMCEGKDGRIYWATAETKNIPTAGGYKTSNFLLVSDDGGKSWEYRSEIAADSSISFNETSLYQTPKGDLVAFMRTAGNGDQPCIARSVDGGKTFSKWESMGFQGHPLQALRLPDDRVLLVYGYRHKPYGIRARILNAECTDYRTAPEIIIRNDGGGGDLGYPWAVLLDEDRVLVTYYFNKEDGVRHIAGSILEITP